MRSTASGENYAMFAPLSPFQRKIKPRHGNPFAIIHFFPAPALAMIAKTVLAKKM
ncbi:hypothetical protein LNP24_04110 [Klebsiella pneumoniae subsp. pneumoniae]|nr:hypothetical protein [Klebsiella pneumoniae subsp. pneumoniae]